MSKIRKRRSNKIIKQITSNIIPVHTVHSVVGGMQLPKRLFKGAVQLKRVPRIVIHLGKGRINGNEILLMKMFASQPKVGHGAH